MVKLILEIKEEETVTFKNSSAYVVGTNIAIQEIGIKATRGEKEASEYIRKKLGFEEKVQIVNLGKKNTALEELIKNLIK